MIEHPHFLSCMQQQIACMCDMLFNQSHRAVYVTTSSVSLTVCVCVCIYMWICDGGMMSTVKEERTPVWNAAFRGHVDVVKYLVMEADADPHKPNKVW